MRNKEESRNRHPCLMVLLSVSGTTKETYFSFDLHFDCSPTPRFPFFIQTELFPASYCKLLEKLPFCFTFYITQVSSDYFPWKCVSYLREFRIWPPSVKPTVYRVSTTLNRVPRVHTDGRPIIFSISEHVVVVQHSECASAQRERELSQSNLVQEESKIYSQNVKLLEVWLFFY